MDYSRARETLKQKLPDLVTKLTHKSEKGSYICPLCGSGTGKNKTGAFSLYGDQTKWKCHACGKGGDIFDLIGEFEHISEPLEQLKMAASWYGIDLEEERVTRKEHAAADQQKKTAAAQKEDTHTDISIHTTAYTQQDAEKKDTTYLEYYKECQKRLKETDYFSKRGISDEVAARFMLGYDPNYSKGTGGKKWKAAIIPTGYYSYVARNTDPEAKDRYRKTGETVPLNILALQKAQKPIFITEGEIDALSIIEAGGEAIGLGSAANINKFVNNYLKQQKPEQPLILALDNDEAGEKAAEALSKELEGLNISFYREDLYNGEKDANAALLADRKAFETAITRAERRAESMEEEAIEAIEAEKAEYRKSSAGSRLQEFVNGIAKAADTPAQPTGFTKLDEVLDGGLYEGLYILGAITSLGKTTLALQIADQIAQSGRDVIIFSLEMAANELISKSISRHTIQEVLSDPNGDIKNAKTNRGITAGARYVNYSQTERDLITRSIEAYSKYADHIFIHEGIGDIGTEQIKNEVKKHIFFTGQTPVVVVDYVQILAPYNPRATDKQNVDKAIVELKRISRDYKTPVIGISSFNRASYREAVTLEAFKESGSLEYGSDVLIGLQLQGAGETTFDSTEAKRKDPREIELVILKNRNGRVGSKITFNYYPLFNYFKELGEATPWD